MELKDRKPLSPEAWQDVEHIFIEALDLPEEERLSFLEKACHGNKTLREEIDSLLAAHIATVGLLDEFDAERAAGLLRTEISETAFQYGPYEVVREIGRGGMGTVFEARRADGQFEQKVALKVIRNGLGSEAIVQRFLQERQILARLQHPQIARLLDGGISKNGQPFFAMEYIEGQPVKTYCDEQKLTIEERLRLFVDVCDAVQYAHRNLVVHRDLKPGNILVTRDQEVKLLDFGIAKLLEGTSVDEPMPVTDTGIKAMTPEYASPEQVKGEVITTSTDVYALGVVLYELLVGRRPYQLDRSSMHHVVEAICNTEPLSPAQALADSSDMSLLADQRAISESKLRRQLSGDIEAILGLRIGQGEQIFFVGCAMHALYAPLSRMLNRGEPLIVYSFLGICGGLLVTGAYGAGDLLATDWAALPSIAWAAVFYLAIMATALTFFLIQYATLRLPSAKVMAYGYLVPVFVILWEGMLGHGWIAAPVWLGIAAVVAGLLILLKD